MFEDGIGFVYIRKGKRKSERRKASHQWLGFDETEETFEAIKPRKQKQFKYDDEVEPRDTKRDFRKDARRKEKWAFDERDY